MLLADLEHEGSILRTRLDGRTAWCERRLLARIHRYTLETLRREIEPVSAILDQQLGDQVVRQILFELFLARVDVSGLDSLFNLGDSVMQALLVLRARDDAVAYADDNRLDDLGGGRRPRDCNKS